MNEMLPSAPLLAGFLTASLVLAVTPGPGVLYIVTRSMTEGRVSGLASVAGVALGNMVNAVAASIGIAAIFAVSALAFSAVKYAGAAYLIYLGLRAFRSVPANAPEQAIASANHRKVFRDGFVVAVLNPKTALFFAAFLPQFMPGPASLERSALLGAIFVAIAFVTDSLYALTASAVAPALSRAGRAGTWGRYASGTIFIGLGVLSALSGSDHPQ